MTSGCPTPGEARKHESRGDKMSDETLAHLVGDYLAQTHKQATGKTSAWLPAVTHAASYTACFLPLTRSWKALAVIGSTHAVIDHYRPVPILRRWREGVDTPTGFPEGTPDWLSGWLNIIADNTIHLLINRCALKWL
jgi:hypothetical protein